MTYGKRAISLALAAVLLAGSLAGTLAEAAGDREIDHVSIEGWSFSLASGDISIDNGYFARLYDTENPLSHYNYSNQWGELLTEDGFDEARAFSEGLAYVKYGDIDGYIDTTGTLVIQLPAGTTMQGKFHDGRALIHDADGSSYYIDKSGTPIIRCAANILSGRHSFSNGLAVGSDAQSGLYGYYNETGNWEIPPQYDSAMSFEGGCAIVSKNGNYGVIDVSGTEIIPFEYDFIYSVSSEPALFALRSRTEGAVNKYIFGLANSHGTILVKPQNVWNFNGTFSDGYCPIFFQGTYLPGLLTESGTLRWRRRL